MPGFINPNALPNVWQARFGEHLADDLDFAAGSVFGCRWWYYTDVNHALHGFYLPWVPGVNTAVCLSAEIEAKQMAAVNQTLPTWKLPKWMVEQREGPDHEAPAEKCGCGFYAFWHDDDERCAVSQSTFAIHVFGVVEGYGRVMLGDKGFRCGQARVVAAWIDDTEWLSDTPVMLSLGDTTVELRSPDVAALAAKIGARYGIPMYRDRALMLQRHPLTAPPM